MKKNTLETICLVSCIMFIIGLALSGLGLEGLIEINRKSNAMLGLVFMGSAMIVAAFVALLVTATLPLLLEDNQRPSKQADSGKQADTKAKTE